MACKHDNKGINYEGDLYRALGHAAVRLTTGDALCLINKTALREIYFAAKRATPSKESVSAETELCAAIERCADAVTIWAETPDDSVAEIRAMGSLMGRVRWAYKLAMKVRGRTIKGS